MKRVVNPFEPWRPQETPVPPPIHAGRPWRPAPPTAKRRAVEDIPFAEPVDPPRRGKAVAAPPKRAPVAAKQPASRRTPISQLFGMGLFIVLMLVGIDSLDWLRGSHLPRLAALGASAGTIAGLALSRRRGWHERLLWMAAALAFAGVAAWFVPTLEGVNLWSGYRQIEELRALPAGDVGAFQRGATERRKLVEAFPAFASDVRSAELAWVRRTVDEGIENADRQMEKDPRAALAALRRLNDEMMRSGHYPAVQAELATAQRRLKQAPLARNR